MNSQAIWAYIHQFSKHLEKEPPSKLYHYASSQEALRSLKTGELWASSLLFTQNPSEATKVLNLSLRLLGRLLEKTQMPHDLNKTVQFSYSTQANKRFKLYQFLLLQNLKEKLLAYLKGSQHVVVLSYSEHADLAAFWEHCEGQSGYALGYSSQHLVSQASEQHFALSPCYYASEDEQRTLTQGALLGGLQAWLGRIQELYEKEKDQKKAYLASLKIIEEEAVRVHDILIQVASLLKHEAFKSEQEWRLVSQSIPAEYLHYHEPCNEQGGMFVPYAPFDTGDALRAVTLKQPKASLAALGLKGFLSTKPKQQGISIALSKHIESKHIIPKDSASKDDFTQPVSVKLEPDKSLS